MNLGSHGGVLVNSSQLEVIDQFKNAKSIVDCHFLHQIDVFTSGQKPQFNCENLHSGFKSVFLICIFCLALNSIFSEIAFCNFGKS